MTDTKEAERHAWLVALVVLAAAVLGLFANGPVAQGTASASDGRLTVPEPAAWVEDRDGVGLPVPRSFPPPGLIAALQQQVDQHGQHHRGDHREQHHQQAAEPAAERPDLHVPEAHAPG